MGFKLMAGAVASCALIGVAVGVGIIYGSLLKDRIINILSIIIVNLIIRKYE